jgi:hypothetical protein
MTPVKIKRVPVEELRRALADGRLTRTEIEILRARIRALARQESATTPASFEAWENVGSIFKGVGRTLERNCALYEKRYMPSRPD